MLARRALNARTTHGVIISYAGAQRSLNTNSKGEQSQTGSVKDPTPPVNATASARPNNAAAMLAGISVVTVLGAYVASCVTGSTAAQRTMK
jgi:hypothetical protein